MLAVPEEQLQLLKCYKCDGILSFAPVMVSQEGAQVCGVCYKQLSPEARTGLVRQVAYEALARLMSFPCRYSLNGCSAQFPWNDSVEHEQICPYRLRRNSANASNTFRENCIRGIELATLIKKSYADEESIYEEIDNVNVTQTAYNDDNINIQIWFERKQTKSIRDVQLKYHLEIQGNSKTNTKLKLDTYGAIEFKNYANTYYNDAIKIVMDGIVTFNSAKATKNIQCDVSVVPIKNILDLVYFQRHLKCHRNGCILCAEKTTSINIMHCKYVKYGCNVLLKRSRIGLHETDCEFGFFLCPLKNVRCCSSGGTLDFITEHVRISHPDDVKAPNEIIHVMIHRDDFWIIQAVNAVFKCRYWNNGDDVEFLVQYIGSQQHAKLFSYEIEVKNATLSNGNKKLSAVCCGWNDCSLESGINLSKKSLKDFVQNNDTIAFTIKILD